MEFKGINVFTKGKWEYSKSNTGSFIIIVDNNYIGSFRDEANAKLIASAPEMLEMLNKVLKENHCTPDLDLEIEQLIKKATNV